MSYSTDRETLQRECEVSFFRASGPGGQHRNTSETGVRLFHPPSGLTVIAVERRSQNQNLEMAFQRLIVRLKQLNRPRKTRKATNPTRNSIRRRLAAKQLHGQKKRLRRTPGMDD